MATITTSSLVDRRVLAVSPGLYLVFRSPSGCRGYGRQVLGRLRYLLVPAVAALLVLAAATTRAEASRWVQYGIQDDAWLLAGPDPDALPARIALLKKLGVGIVRYNLEWSVVAAKRPAQGADPDDPAYDWGAPDTVLDALQEAGIPVLLTVNGTPSWANRRRPPSFAPSSARDFTGFLTAAAERYPWVRKWTIWNEPNQARWLRPSSPKLYVSRLLNPGYAALHRAIPGVQVSAGGTAPRAGTDGISPLAWLDGLHAAHARFDAYAHNPYPLSPQETPFTGACGHCTTVTMASMSRLIARLDGYFGKKPVWLTEYGYQTSPPDTHFGVSWAKQAQFVSEAALRAYQLPQVTVLIHYLYRDEPVLGAWQSGLQTGDGKIKPSFQAFRLPLAAIPGPRGTATLWGQVRTGSGRRPYVLQQLVDGRWKSLGGTRLTSSNGFFQVRVRADKGARFRFLSPQDRAYSPTVLVS
jgi:hypothetical protein